MTFARSLILLSALGLPAAAGAAPSYVASLAAPAKVERLVSSDRLWSCSGTTCAAGGEATSPARNICSRIAEEAGLLLSFSARGRSFTAEELARCNARAGHAVAPVAAK